MGKSKENPKKVERRKSVTEVITNKLVKLEIEKPSKSKCTLILLNFPIFLVGFFLIFLGYAAKDPENFKKLVKLAHKKGVPGPIIKLVQEMVKQAVIFSTGMLISGILIGAFSFLGCWGAMCSKKFLKIYRLLLIFTFLAIAALGYFAYEYIHGRSVFLLASMLSKIFVHYNHPQARQFIFTIQLEGKCCGGISPEDWQQNGIYHQNFYEYLDEKNKTELITGSDPVPDSCCTRPDVNCGLFNNDTEHINALDSVIDHMWGDDEKGQEEFDELFSSLSEETEKLKEQSWDPEAFDHDYEQNSEYYDYYGHELYEYYDEYGEFDWGKYKEENEMDMYDYYAVYDFYYYGYDYYSNPDDEYYYDARTGQRKPNKKPRKELPDNYRIKNRKKLEKVAPEERESEPEPTTGPGIPEEMHIWKFGCAVKYGKLLERNKTKVTIIIAFLEIPVLLCIIMASKVIKYFDEKDEQEENYD